MAAHHNTQIGQKLAFAALFTCLSVPAFAQTIPLPTPRPVLQAQSNVTGTAAAPAPKAPAPAHAQATQPAKPPNPITNPFAALLGKPGSTGALSPEQRAIVERVNGYLSSVQALTGNFIQVGPDGSRTQGEFFISKPGRVRFEYDDPSPIELIADGIFGRGARPPAGDSGCLSVVADAVAFPARRTGRSDEGHASDRGLCRRRLRQQWWSKKKAALSVPAG